MLTRAAVAMIAATVSAPAWAGLAANPFPGGDAAFRQSRTTARWSAR